MGSSVFTIGKKSFPNENFESTHLNQVQTKIQLKVSSYKNNVFFNCRLKTQINMLRLRGGNR